MTIYLPLEIPETLAAGPGPGNTDPRVLERVAKAGLADHMQQQRHRLSVYNVAGQQWQYVRRRAFFQPCAFRRSPNT